MNKLSINIGTSTFDIEGDFTWSDAFNGLTLFFTNMQSVDPAVVAVVVDLQKKLDAAVAAGSASALELADMQTSVTSITTQLKAVDQRVVQSSPS